MFGTVICFQGGFGEGCGGFSGEGGSRRGSGGVFEGVLEVALDIL